ncbi:hypothetical protein C8R43DRAFT_1132738 [Mycena crocata]|nr:hypothetical protein C8R43DRAFT_1132738 [Mycena crocata]
MSKKKAQVAGSLDHLHPRQGVSRNLSPPAARWDVPLLWSAKAAGTPMPSFPYPVGRPTVPRTPTQKKYL